MSLALKPGLALQHPRLLVSLPNIVRSRNFPTRIRFNCLGSMATSNDETKAPVTKDQGEDEKQRTKRRERKIVPPPPEKPEPGDCCGSGCVRCVWDVYYDELEEYNRLHGSGSKDSRAD